jgi:mRNA-degrading endonuclease RelE of RelBE toxin-antitoxin system
MLRVVLTKRAAAALQKLPPEIQAACLEALRELPAVFGRPHAHAGLGVRQLRPGVYELRISLQMRTIFVRSADVLEVQMIGNHDIIRRYLRGRA